MQTVYWSDRLQARLQAKLNFLIQCGLSAVTLAKLDVVSTGDAASIFFMASLKRVRSSININRAKKLQHLAEGTA